MLTRYSGSGSGTIRFDGRTANGPVSWTERVNFGRDSRENSFVARLWATQRVGYLSAEKRRNGGSREVDDEIRELGEKYSIPTEFTSYLVLEPGMDPRDFSGRGLRADNVVVTGVATGVTRSGKAGSGPPPPPTAAAAPAVQAFEKARAAAEQRATTNLADADASIATNTDMRRVGTRTFARRGDTWVDTGKRDSMQVTKVRAFSEAYFKLIEAIPELREVLALGDKVTVAGKSIAIEIGDDGVSSLDESKLRQIQERWQ
jgi:hypothetical protein